jgi:hypothetical protein
MLRNRKKSFIELNIDTFGHTIVEMENLEIMQTKITSEMKTVIMESAIRKINKQQNFFTNLINYQYYFLKYYLSFLTILFCKKFVIHKMFFFQKEENEETYHSNKSVLYLYDNGIFFSRCHIPYENILQFGMEKDMCVIHILAKIKKENDVLTLSLDKNILRVVFKMDSPGYFFNCMKTNMFYHIKYNKVNDNAIEYYFEDRYKLTPVK